LTRAPERTISGILMAVIRAVLLKKILTQTVSVELVYIVLRSIYFCLMVRQGAYCPSFDLLQAAINFTVICGIKLCVYLFCGFNAYIFRLSSLAFARSVDGYCTTAAKRVIFR